MSHPVRLAVVTAVVLIFAALLLPELAWAGPGGEVAEFMFKTRIGRIIGLVLLIVLLPLILYVTAREWFGVRRARRDLATLSTRYSYFAWPQLEAYIRKATKGLYGSWTSGDLSPVGSMLTGDFFESQQAILDRWTEEGKRNVTRLEKLTRVKPLMVSAETDDSLSVLVVSVTMNLVDYIEKVDSKKVVKGTKKAVKGHELVFTFLHVEGDWLLHSIDEGSVSLAFASAPNSIDTSYLDRQAKVPGARAGRAAAPADASATEELPEDQSVEASQDDDSETR